MQCAAAAPRRACRCPLARWVGEEGQLSAAARHGADHRLPGSGACDNRHGSGTLIMIQPAILVVRSWTRNSSIDLAAYCRRSESSNHDARAHSTSPSESTAQPGTSCGPTSQCVSRHGMAPAVCILNALDGTHNCRPIGGPVGFDSKRQRSGTYPDSCLR
jgi:hypothetical protein